MTTIRCENVGRGSIVPCKGTVRIYRFYNMDVNKFGEPFALCDVHKKEQPIPENCYLDELSV